MKANELKDGLPVAADTWGEDEDDFTMPVVPEGNRRALPKPRQKTSGLSALPDGEVPSMLVRQALQALPCGDIAPTDDAINKAATIGLMEAIEPRDAIEGMIAAQMIGMHNLTMECLRRAQFSTGPNRDALLNQINKTGRTFGLLVETLNKHRGKGRQQMVVKHVHVHQGGQAIVGSVDAGAKAAVSMAEGETEK